MDPEPTINRTLQDNIEAFAQRRRDGEQRAGTGERISVAVTRFAGSVAFLAVHAVIFSAWAAANLKLVPGVKPFDPSLVMLATFASVEAIFISTFVLIAQNRMAAAADKRANLDLHMSLLVEAELSHLADLTLRIADKVGVEAPEPEIREVAERVDPGQVLDELERREAE
jgi:uncharacterized membrane protein